MLATIPTGIHIFEFGPANDISYSVLVNKKSSEQDYVCDVLTVSIPIALHQLCSRSGHLFNL